MSFDLPAALDYCPQCNFHCQIFNWNDNESTHQIQKLVISEEVLQKPLLKYNDACSDEQKLVMEEKFCTKVKDDVNDLIQVMNLYQNKLKLTDEKEKENDNNPIKPPIACKQAKIEKRKRKQNARNLAMKTKMMILSMTKGRRRFRQK